MTDIGVIDMAAGYFAYLDYSTNSVLSFELVRNLAQWARQAVSKAAARPAESETRGSPVDAEIPLPVQDVYSNSIPEVSLRLQLPDKDVS